MANKLEQAYNILSTLPGGKSIYSILLGLMVPYTGTIRAKVLELSSGYAKVELKDRKIVRNHLNSIHAMALANLGEISTGLALNYSLPEDMMSILVGFNIEYLKKARGTLVSECRLPVIDPTQKQEVLIEGVIMDSSNIIVAKVKARWLIAKSR